VRFPQTPIWWFPQVSVCPHDLGSASACFRAEVGDPDRVQTAAGRMRGGPGLRGVGAAGHAGSGAELALPVGRVGYCRRSVSYSPSLGDDRADEVAEEA
jgi:hypothetical protein